MNLYFIINLNYKRTTFPTSSRQVKMASNISMIYWNSNNVIENVEFDRKHSFFGTVSVYITYKFVDNGKNGNCCYIF